MTHKLNGANVTAQWFQHLYPEAEFFSHLEKFCLHTTETKSWPSYDGGAKAPNATYHPLLRQTRQHFDSDRSSRALQDPSSTTVRENRDNIFQLEIIAYSDYALAQSVDGLWIGDLTEEHYADIAEMLQQLHNDLGLPLEASVQWREGRKTAYNDVRLNGPAYDAYKGILGHVHVSGNSHWDPGGFYYSQLAAKVEEAVMALTDADKTWLRSAINAEVIEALEAARPWRSASVRAWAEANGISSEVSHRSMQEYLYKTTGNSTHSDVSVDLDDIKVTLETPPPVVVDIDYDLLAAKVVEKLVASTELGFRPATP